MSRYCSNIGVGAFVGVTLSASALALPPLSRPFGTEPPLSVQGNGSTSGVSVASDGEKSLVVFDDGRDIRGMLASADGRPLYGEMATYALSATPGTGKYAPKVAYGAGKYLAVWSDSINGLEGRFIGADGAVQGETFPIRKAAAEPQLAWVDGQFLLTTVEIEDSIRSVAATTITVDGEVGERKLLTSDGIASQLSMAAGPGGALLAWIPNTDGTNLRIEAMLIDGSGESLAPPFVVTEGSFPGDASVRSSVTGYLITWGQYEGVRSLTVDAQGEVGPILEIADGAAFSGLTSAVNAKDYTVMWQVYPDDGYAKTALRHVSLDGQLGQETYVLEHGLYKPTLVAKDDGYWLMAVDNGLWGTFTDDELKPSGERQALSLIQSSQYVTELIWDGTSYAMLFDDDRGGKYTSHARVMRFSTAGVSLDQPSLGLDQPSDTFSWYSALSLGGGNTLIGCAASETSALSFRTLKQDGGLTPVIDHGTFGTSGGVTLAAFEGRYLAVYPATEFGKFWAQEFNAVGEPVSDPRALPLPDTTYDARVHGGADGFTLQISDGSTTSLAALHDDWTLGALQPFATGIFPIDFIVGGGRTLAVWPSGSAGRTARFWSNGAWDGQAVMLTGDASSGDTIWNGSQFIAVWSDSTYHGHLTTIDSDGTVAPSESLFGDEECNGPTLTSNGAGQTMLSCVRYNRDYSRRIVNYLIGEGADNVADNDVTPVEPDVTSSGGVTSSPELTSSSEVSPSDDETPEEPSPTTAGPDFTTADDVTEVATDIAATSSSSTSTEPTTISEPAIATPPRGTTSPKPTSCDVARAGGGTRDFSGIFGLTLALSFASGLRRRFAMRNTQGETNVRR